ncbi:MAG: S41 family peptidase [Kiritimatiellae bacterium]|nr:S41 family peptidase [Kiritimatiellia bacterium]
MNQRHSIFYALSALLVFVNVVACAWAQEDVDVVETNVQEEAYSSMEVLAEALLHVRKHYVEEKTYDQILDGTLDSLLSSLDPYSSFLMDQEYEGMRDDTEGAYEGIGVHIGIKDHQLTVIAPIEGTPGARAGLHSGDRIVAIEGELTKGLSLRDALKLLRGRKGSKVRLTISPSGGGEDRELEIVRDVVEVPSVKGRKLVQDGIGYLRITQFARPTASNLADQVEMLLNDGMEALVLDLRGNPGGLLSSAIEVSELFLKKGKLIVSTKGREGVYPEKSVVASRRMSHDFPLAILINQGSASASEIVAGAFQDHKRAVLVGEQSYGKGSVQSVVKLKSDPASAIRLTTARYYTPSGRMIHGTGIAPDVPVSIESDEWRAIVKARMTSEEDSASEALIDRQLERAVDLLHAITIFNSAAHH